MKLANAKYASLIPLYIMFPARTVNTRTLMLTSMMVLVFSGTPKISLFQLSAHVVSGKGGISGGGKRAQPLGVADSQCILGAAFFPKHCTQVSDDGVGAFSGGKTTATGMVLFVHDMAQLAGSDCGYDDDVHWKRLRPTLTFW
jgi:hypothetical protein